MSRGYVGEACDSTGQQRGKRTDKEKGAREGEECWMLIGELY